MKKEQMERLWEELSGGADGIYQRYLQARELRNQEYEAQKKQAKQDYQQELDRLSADAKIRQLNTRAALADQGLASSGESLHAQLMNDYVHSRAAAQSAKSYSDTKEELNREQREKNLQGEQAMEQELSSLNQSLYRLGLEEKQLEQQEQQFLKEQEHKQKELEQEQKQWEGEQALAKEKLREQQRLEEQAQISREEREEYEKAILALEQELAAKKEGTGTVPDKSAQALYKDVLYAAQTQYANGDLSDEQEYERLVRDFVTRKLKQLIADEELDADYRKSLAIYGMLGGYLTEE